MNKFILPSLLVTLLAITACGKKDDDSANAGAPDNAKVEKAEEAPRAATYDPNLKPSQIVWDSPEKQKAWEAKKAELKKAAAKQ